MKAKESRQRSKEEQQKILQEHQEKLRLLRFGLASGKVKNVREIRKIKKAIARILTISKEQ